MAGNPIALAVAMFLFGMYAGMWLAELLHKWAEKE